MKKTAILILLVLIRGIAMAQQQHRIDSLERALLDAPDTTKVRIYRQLASLTSEGNVKIGLQYAERALAIATRKKDAALQAAVLTDIGSIHRDHSDYRTAIRFFKQAVLTQRDSTHAILAETWFELGIAYLRITALDSSQQVLSMGLTIAQRVGDKHIEAGIYNCLGNVAKDKNNFQRATENYLQAIDIFEATKDQAGLTQTLSNLGNIHALMGNYESALQYALKSLDIAKAIDKKSSIAYSNRLLGRIYRKLGKFDDAIGVYNDAILIYATLGARRDVGETFLNKGNIYFERLQFPLALADYKQSLGVVRNIRDTANMVYAMAAIGMTMVETNENKDAFLYLDSALQFSKQLGMSHMLMDIYQSLSQLREKESKYQDAYHYHKLFAALKDSLNEIQNREEAQELAAKYQTKQQESEIATLNAQNELKAIQLSQRNTERNYLLGFIILCLTLVALVYNRYVVKLKTAKKLEELDHLKSRFFGNISHEFRTPLSLIIGPLQQKLTSALDPAERKQSETMLRNADRLRDLINQLLDLSKIEAGQMKLRVSKTDPHAFLCLILPSFTSLAVQKDIQYDFTVCEPQECYFDRDKVEKIINNLLSNALKFTRKGGNVQVRTTIDNGHLKILVRDTGIGIAPEKIEHIFKRFYQVDDSNTRPGEGSGIGLALSKELALLHRGDLSVQSDLDKGSTFVLEIPIRRGAYASEEIIELVMPSLSGQSASVVHRGGTAESNMETAFENDAPVVLVAEDNDDMRRFIASILEKDFNVVVATDGVAALERAESIIPDLIVSDVMMPRVDGQGVCEKVKSQKATSHIPVILLTAKADQESKLEGLKIGADDYLVKPFDPNELLVRVRNLIEQRKKLRVLFATEILLAPQQLPVTEPEAEFINNVLDIVSRRYQDANFGVEAFTVDIGLSRMQLHRKLKAVTGKSPGDFIRQFRLERAQQLLRVKGIQVSQVAFEVGFNNLSHFTKAFRDFSGVTPSEYALRAELSTK